MYNGLYAGRRPPSLEEQCVAQLKVWEPHVSLRNVELLSQVADELKLDDLPLRELTGSHFRRVVQYSRINSESHLLWPGTISFLSWER